ncbi:probable polygalacturonase At3g15720 [Rosa chinensis]|uniref:probable polygalacturonase At3g15720 n=1 Tax=Rosa chinensis TaxID=74649 RepID=UPI001AD93D08|nr:probable polygalacturonase At3g15720 [Rosa chinensis]
MKQILVLGKVVAPKTPDAWKQCESNYWLSFSYVANLRMNGGSGIIDGQGSSWWSNANEQKLHIDDKKKCQRPKALHFHGCHNLLLTGLTHVNSPKGHISISNCRYVYVANLTITAPEESPNTDGIDISNSNHVNIHASYIGTGDDCIAINSGCSNINITNIACGPGHGISVGSLGENGAYATVENVSVKNCNFSRTQNGVRIKTWQGGSGYAKNITFEQITLHATKNPIIIDQYYCNGAHNCKNKTSAVKVSDVRYRNIQGTSAKKEAIRLDCNQFSGCRNIVMEHINITSNVPGNKGIQASCYNINGISKSTVPRVLCLQSKLVQ